MPTATMIHPIVHPQCGKLLHAPTNTLPMPYVYEIHVLKAQYFIVITYITVDKKCNKEQSIAYNVIYVHITFFTDCLNLVIAMTLVPGLRPARERPMLVATLILRPKMVSLV